MVCAVVIGHAVFRHPYTVLSMPVVIRRYLPSTLFILGVAFAVLMLFMALLSLDNPLMVAGLLVGGVAGGAAIAGAGVLVENSEAARLRSEREVSNTKALTKAMADLSDALRALQNG